MNRKHKNRQTKTKKTKFRLTTRQIKQIIKRVRKRIATVCKRNCTTNRRSKRIKCITGG